MSSDTYYCCNTTHRWFIKPRILIFAFIEPNEDTEAQEQEDKSPPDDVVLQFPSEHTASQNVNQNTAVVMMPSCPEDTKL